MHAAGGEPCYRDINAALGLSFMVCVRDTRRSLASWMTEGRDVFLIPTAALFGIRLRELHPPGAAVGLETLPEFAQHFEASYRPLIKTAIENNQPVLVWRGWPGDAAEQWGVVTAISDEGIGLCGATVTSGGDEVVLTAPPVQMHIVEEIKPKVPPEGELLRLAVRNARLVLEDKTDRRFGITTGPDVYRSWRQRLPSEKASETEPAADAKSHHRMAEAIVHARRSAVEFLSHHCERLGNPARVAIDGAVVECRGVIRALLPFCDLGTVRGLLQSEEGREKLAGGIKSAQAHEARLRDHIADLSSQM